MKKINFCEFFKINLQTLSTWGKKSISKAKNSEEKSTVETKIVISQENNVTEDEALKKSKLTIFH